MTLPQILLRFFSTHSSRLPKGASILVACSGGPDSVGLATGLKAISKQLSYRFRIAHVNHALRQAASDHDARFVEKLAKKLGWPFHSKRCPVSFSDSGNTEEQARVKRYEALQKMAHGAHCQAILTAHTLDDQVETILMNLARGTGPDGLGGMMPFRKMENSSIFLGRPFLGTTKDEVLEYVNQSKASFQWDHTNADQKFTRNWMRGTLIPLWEGRSPGIKRRIANMGQLMQDELSYWNGILRGATGNIAKPHEGGQLVDMKKLTGYPVAVQRRFLRRIAGLDLLTFDAVERLRNWMKSPPSDGRHFQLKRGGVVERMSKSKGSPSADLFWFHKAKIPHGTHKRKKK